MKNYANHIKVFGFLSLLLLVIPLQAQESPKLTDPEIASVAVVANQIDIDFAKIALQKSKNKEVQDFANRMIEDHTAVIEQAVALVTKLKVTPIDNAVSQSLLKQAEDTKVNLEKAKKNDFDKYYVDNEVAYHKQVIGAVNDLLIPETKNQELKELLETVVPALETHLGHAQMLQNKLTSKK
ncbi:hypothetical protein DHD08_05845 [Arenibacter sp. H213]|uniref:DUF4142 domain-containing protein n=1 Tax=Arenibacter antarcticus TaxID=2040469 RepID=A0ABW5VIE8_9FLAO|nr:DUF4142 domain-containing protein [Arenibacter sp. H213]MCM4167203.1 hypothetical protein [Arenibacter sp. H213]